MIFLGRCLFKFALQHLTTTFKCCLHINAPASTFCKIIKWINVLLMHWCIDTFTQVMDPLTVRKTTLCLFTKSKYFIETSNLLVQNPLHYTWHLCQPLNVATHLFSCKVTLFVCIRICLAEDITAPQLFSELKGSVGKDPLPKSNPSPASYSHWSG